MGDDGIIKVKLNYQHPNSGYDITNANHKRDMDAVKASQPYMNFQSYDSNKDGKLFYRLKGTYRTMRKHGHRKIKSISGEPLKKRVTAPFSSLKLSSA